MAILSAEDRARVSAAVAAAERNTAGEIVAYWGQRSGSYAEARAAWAFALTVAMAIALLLLGPGVPELWIVCAQAPLGLALYVLLGLPWITRLIVPARVQREAVGRRARQLFLDLGVSETRDRSGVLVYVSQTERRIEILGDRGIHQHVGDAGWKQLVGELSSSIAKGQAADGLVRVIEKIGAELANKFPPRPDDVNELGNELVTDGTR
jgi:putative membrane protein